MQVDRRAPRQDSRTLHTPNPVLNYSTQQKHMEHGVPSQILAALIHTTRPHSLLHMQMNKYAIHLS